jgi:hypothetical protein
MMPVESVECLGRSGRSAGWVGALRPRCLGSCALHRRYAPPRGAGRRSGRAARQPAGQRLTGPARRASHLRSGSRWPSRGSGGMTQFYARQPGSGDLNTCSGSRSAPGWPPASSMASPPSTAVKHAPSGVDDPRLRPGLGRRHQVFTQAIGKPVFGTVSPLTPYFLAQAGRSTFRSRSTSSADPGSTPPARPWRRFRLHDALKTLQSSDPSRMSTEQRCAPG